MCDFCIKLDEGRVDEDVQQLMELFLIVGEDFDDHFGDVVMREIGEMVMIFQ